MSIEEKKKSQGEENMIKAIMEEFADLTDDQLVRVVQLAQELFALGQSSVRQAYEKGKEDALKEVSVLFNDEEKVQA